MISATRSLFGAEIDPALDVVPPQPEQVEQVEQSDTVETTASKPERRAEWQKPMTLFRWSLSGEPVDPTLFDPLVSNRPTFTGTSSTVGPKGQYEVGFTYIYNNNDDISTRTRVDPEFLWRACLVANWLEFRLGIRGLNQRVSSPTGLTEVAGTDDLYLGMMLGLTRQVDWLPETALIAQMTIPTADDEFTNDEVLPGGKFIYSWRLGDYFSAGGSTQANSRIDFVTGKYYVEFAQSWVLRMRVIECVGTYAEWFAFSPHDADTAPVEHYFNVGMTVLCFDNFQIDFRYGQGLNRTADDYFFGVGGVARWR